MNKATNDSTLAKVMRYCDDIGMWALDRPIAGSCVHKTSYCEATCFNNKLYNVYGKGMNGKDVRNEAAWIENDAKGMAVALGRKRKGVAHNRIRLMTRGEAFSNFADIARVENIAKANPEKQIWVPSRVWRSPLLLAATMEMVSRNPNVILLASMDPSNTSEEWEFVKTSGLSTMFFGDDEMNETPNGDRVFKCPKTHKHINGHCGICKGGCFRTNKRVDVHLKQH